jgi:hypothetical protein
MLTININPLPHPTQEKVKAKHDVVLNLLKPSRYFTYHQVQHSRILHGAHIAFMCSVWISDQTAMSTLDIIN